MFCGWSELYIAIRTPIFVDKFHFTCWEVVVDKTADEIP